MICGMYTSDEVEKLRQLYLSDKLPTDEIATILGKSKRSIIHKLLALGVYKKQPKYLNKQGEVPVSKSRIIDEIIPLLGTDAEAAASLEKVTKPILKLILSRLQSKT